MASFNKVILIGRLTRDPEKRYTGSGLALTSFSIAVDRPFKDPQTGEKKTDFFRCKAWRQKAEYVADYAQKGRLVAVEGRIETSENVGPDGQKKFFTDIVCDNVEFLESTRDGAGEAAPGGFGGGGRNGASNNDDGASGGGGDDNSNGYFADDEPAPAPARAPQRPAQAQSAPQRPAQAPQRAQAAAAPPQRSAAPQRPAGRAPEPAYPADDFDDSDPFADE
jgi:single-strand DNA-binding protein